MTAILPLLLAATIPLRNPFWPVGHAGTRESITDEPRIQVKAQAETAEDRETSVTPEAVAAAAAEEAVDETQAAARLWIAARKSLKIGATMRGSENRQSVSINGKIYSDGDLVSVNYDGRRFTWRVKRLTENGSLKLQRIRLRDLDEVPEPKKGTGR